ncbi:MAG: hypothetical protein PHP51_03785 [Desulfotomaculaceae bacterium]|nr:hypothetical protein [Desulfotomaculaceae bacterium]MDD4766761.1 hypothetical protein [Desulfotomaculaceae bacterium]
MDGGNGPKRKARTGLLKLFRDALNEAMEKDPVGHIKDSYNHKLDSEYSTELGPDPSQDGPGEDPIQTIRDSYDQRLDQEFLVQTGSISEAEAQEADPIQYMRDTYDKILDTEYTKPAAVPDAPQQENNNDTGVDPLQRIKEAYGQMFDNQENKYQAGQKQNEQLPWWKKLF